MSRLILIAALCGLLVGCDRSSPSSSSSSSSSSGGVDTDDPKALAAEMDKFAAEELAKSKTPAKDWLMNTSNGTFEAKKLDVLKLTNDCIAAGATAWVGEAEDLEGKKLIDHLFIELPTDPAKRKKIFEVYNKDVEGWIEDGAEKDIGQKYLVVDWS